jgi:hypothetical protein
VKNGWLVVLSIAWSGCLFDGGSATVKQGVVNQALLCSAPPAAGQTCSACATPEGSLCRDQWYSSALRCSSDAQCNGTTGACQQGFCVLHDADGDGLDDDFENEVAELNFPTLYMSTGENCGAPHGVIYRARRHPDYPSRLAITYIVLYAKDCGGITGHTGDAESFAITVDLDSQPGATATVGVETRAHNGTICGSTSSCETGPATGACGQSTAESSPAEVVIYASANKHANYLSRSTCSDNCLDTCSPGERIVGPLLNVGEPDHPTVTDLTAQGFVQAPYGWPQELLQFNPWGSAQFSGGGRLDQTLINLTAPPGE